MPFARRWNNCRATAYRPTRARGWCRRGASRRSTGYICKQYGVGVVGRINAVKEEIYVITPERRIRHPATIAVCQAATRGVFATAALRGKGAAR